MAMPNLTTDKVLSDRHRYMLEEESRISPEVITSRGYWTAETVNDLKGVSGIAENQLMAPSLVLPIYGVDGRYRYSRIRPDKPPPDMKYIQPASTTSVLDVPCTVLEKVLDENQSLIIVEGEKKADALASLGLPVVALFGVWNWSYKMDVNTPYEKQLLLKDFESIPLHGRSVSVMFDADIQTKHLVQLATGRLGKKLQDRGAQLW